MNQRFFLFLFMLFAIEAGVVSISAEPLANPPAPELTEADLKHLHAEHEAIEGEDDENIKGIRAQAEAMIQKLNIKVFALNMQRSLWLLTNRKLRSRLLDVAMIMAISHTTETFGGPIITSLFIAQGRSLAVTSTTGFISILIMIPGFVDPLCWLVVGPYFFSVKYRTLIHAIRTRSIRAIDSLGIPREFNAWFDTKDRLEVLELKNKDSALNLKVEKNENEKILIWMNGSEEVLRLNFQADQGETWLDSMNWSANIKDHLPEISLGSLNWNVKSAISDAIWKFKKFSKNRYIEAASPRSLQFRDGAIHLSSQRKCRDVLTAIGVRILAVNSRVKATP